MNTGPTPTPEAVRWVIDHDTAEDLTQILGLIEDFLRHASREAIDELAGHNPVRPLDPDRWADWLADYLGDQVIALHAAATATTTTATTTTATTTTATTTTATTTTATTTTATTTTATTETTPATHDTPTGVAADPTPAQH